MSKISTTVIFLIVNIKLSIQAALRNRNIVFKAEGEGESRAMSGCNRT